MLSKRPRLSGAVYTGKVGAKMRPPRPRRGPVLRVAVTLVGGSLDGASVRLERNSCASTMALAPLRGWPAGRYVYGAWEALK